MSFRVLFLHFNTTFFPHPNPLPQKDREVFLKLWVGEGFPEKFLITLLQNIFSPLSAKNSG